MQSQITPSYFKQLDALRAIAVTMVICSHWAGYHHDLWNDTSFWFNGEVGVQLFFIISGFLITGILLDERQRAEDNHAGRHFIVRAFYIRRFLRIFPLFYATLFVGYALGHPDVRQSILWHVTYLSNLFFAWRGDYLGEVSHFWSLAVEEQFYLFWPLLMLLIPRKFLLPFVLGCVFIGPLFRYWLSFVVQANDVAANVLPLSSLDSLAGGALLAMLRRNGLPEIVRKRLTLCVLGLSIVSALGYILLHTAISVPPDLEAQILFICRVLLIPALAGVVWLFASGFPGRVGALIESRPLAYVGKISYGVYVFHFFIPAATTWICHRLGVSIGQTISVEEYLVLNIMALLLISAISWHCFESPINNLKRFFPYRRTVTSHTAVTAPASPAGSIV